MAQISISPLGQIAFTGSMFQLGASSQVKYWVDVSELEKRVKINTQGGLGFLYADRHASDASSLIPIGIDLDYMLNQNLNLTTTFLLNFTDVETDRNPPIPGRH